MTILQVKMRDQQVAQITQTAMGTVMSHRAFGTYAEESLGAVCKEIARLEGLLSRFRPDSDISRVNQSAGIQSEKVSRETCEVLVKAVEFSRAFPGCLDVTIEPLVNLWRVGKGSNTPPEEDAIQQVLPLVNFRDLVIDPWKTTAGLRCFGQSIDLGGIGKGYAADRIIEVFRRFEITSACSNLGGNVVTLGTRPDGSPWRIGIQHPRQENQIIGAVAVAGQSVVTSGDYQRYFVDSHGRRYHHLLDPKTGYPAQSGLISVSIVCAPSVNADALSTILFVAGLEKGVDFLKKYPETGAILIDTDLRVFVTQNLKGCFETYRAMDVTFLN